MKRLYLLTLAAAMTMWLFAGTHAQTPLRLTTHRLTFQGTTPYTLSVLTNASDLIWSTSDSTVATVDNNTVTPVFPGEATVTVQTADGTQKDTCRIVVEYGVFRKTHPASLKEGRWAMLVGGDSAAMGVFDPRSRTFPVIPVAVDTNRRCSAPAGATVFRLHKDSVFTFISRDGYLAGEAANHTLYISAIRIETTEWSVMPNENDYVSVINHTVATQGGGIGYNIAGWVFTCNPKEEQSPVALYQEVPTFTLRVYAQDTTRGTVNECCGSYVPQSKIVLHATPRNGYHFIRWSDGKTDNPRVLSMPGTATTLMAVFSPLEGKCGDNLQWRYTHDTLYITGSGAMYDFPKITASPWYELNGDIVAISLPQGLTTIGDYAFSNCKRVTDIDIPDSVTKIGKSCFHRCESLSAVSMSDHVTAIGASAFNYCSSMTAVRLSRNIRTIENGTFSGCKALKEIVIPDNVTAIGQSVFSGCTAITSVTLGSSVQSIGKSSFSGCNGLAQLIIHAATPPTVPATLFNYIPATMTVCVPCEAVEAYQTDKTWRDVNIQAMPAFGVSISTSDTQYGSATLLQSDCETHMISIAAIAKAPHRFVQWSDGVTDSIRTVTLTQDTALVAIFAKGMATSGQCGDSIVWQYANGTLTLSGKGDMYHYTAANGKTPAPWTELCDSITDVRIDSRVTSIGKYAFTKCNRLKEVTIPDSVHKICESAFYACAALQSLVIGKGTDSIMSSAFSQCKLLSTIDIPDSVKYIYGSALGGTAWYESQPNGMVYIGKTLYDYKGTIDRNTAFVVREGTISISPWALNDYGSNIISVTLPGSIRYLSKNCISSDGLSAIYMQAATPPAIGKDVFSWETRHEATLYVPCGAREAYEADSVWRMFGSIAYPATYKVVTLSNMPKYGYAYVVESECMGNEVTVYASESDEHVHFVRWSDGDTKRWRTLSLTQDTTLTAIFALSYSGWCGDNLRWTFDSPSHTLTVTGSGEMNDYHMSSYQPWYFFRDSISTIVLPQEMTSVGQYAFSACRYASLVTIPRGVTRVGSSAFLSTMWYDWQPDGLIYIGKALYAYKNMAMLKGDTVVVDEGIVSIAGDAFYLHETTSSPVVPEFSIVLPSTLTEIGTAAFFRSGVTSITCYAEIPPACMLAAFNGVSKTIPVYVPDAAVNDYKTADQWSDFKYIYAIGSQDPSTAVETIETGQETVGNDGSVRKILHNGQILIVRGGEIYSVTGMKIR